MFCSEQGLGRVAVREERPLLAEGWTKQAFPRSPTQTGACASVLRRSQPALEERVRPRKLSFTEEMPRVALASEEKG